MPGKFEVKSAAKGQFMFNLKAGNGEVILTSELYKTKPACLDGVESVRANAQVETHFDRREAKNGQVFFALKAANGQDIGRSELYKTKSSMERGIQSVMRNAPDAKLVELAATKVAKA